jgi:GTPase SAR1 family protein
MNIWDLGGHAMYRTEWATYVKETDVILFVVDASDKKTIGQAKYELH